MRRVRRIGRRRSSRSSRRGADTICAGISRRSSAATADDLNARVLADYRETVSDLLLDTFTSEWRSVGGEPEAPGAQPGARLRRRAFWTCTPRATSRRRKAPRSNASSGRPRPRTWPDGRSSRRKRPRGSASTFAPRSPTCAPRSIDSSSPASTTSSITAPLTRRWGNRGQGGSSTQPSSSVRRMRGGTTSARSTAMWRASSRSCRPGTPDHDVLLYYPFYESLAVRGEALLTHFGGASPPAARHDVRGGGRPAPERRVHLRLHLRSSGPWRTC